MGLIYLIVYLVEVFTWGSCFGMSAGESKFAVQNLPEADFVPFDYNSQQSESNKRWTFVNGARSIQVIKFIKTSGSKPRFVLDSATYILRLYHIVNNSMYIVISQSGQRETLLVRLRFPDESKFKQFVETVLELPDSRLVGRQEVDFKIELRL